MRHRSPLLSIAISSLLFGLSVAKETAAAERPNFVIILADDMGYGDASCYGGERFETPHLDQLAQSGLRFTDFHSNCPVCSPTRAALLTGRYQQRAGIPGVVYANPKSNRHHGLQMREQTIAELLQDAGYATGIMGKWHLGYERQYNPTHQGFDRFTGYVSGNVDYISHLDGTGVHDWWHGLRNEPEDGYSTHLITEHAVQFIEQHKNRPFLLYVAHEAPHYPYQGPDDPAIRLPNKQRQPQLVQPGLSKAEAAQQKRDAYVEMMQAMDDGVGEIVAKLEETGLRKQTLVFFFSDNGATPVGSNGELRGFKGTVWEGGHRVPAIASWPGRIEAGETTDQLGIGFDLYPTLLELANAARPAELALDGRSLVPVLLRNESPTERTVVWDYRGNFAVRRGPWKLVRLKGNPPQLFNLEEDPQEQQDLSAMHSELVAELSAFHEDWREDVSQGATPQPLRASSN